MPSFKQFTLLSVALGLSACAPQPFIKPPEQASISPEKMMEMNRAYLGLLLYTYTVVNKKLLKTIQNIKNQYPDDQDLHKKLDELIKKFNEDK